jgi:hypothetical protein
VALSGFIKNGEVAQQVREVDQGRARVRTENCDARLDCRPCDRRCARDAIARLAKHHPGFPNGIGEDGVVAGQAPELLPCRIVHSPERLGCNLRRTSVRFGKEHIEADHCAASLDDLRDHVGHDSARPRPLPQSPQAPLVNIHDSDKVLARGTRMQQLVDVERLLAESFDGARIPDPQCEQRDEKQEANNPSYPNTSHPFQNKAHGRRSARSLARVTMMLPPSLVQQHFDCRLAVRSWERLGKLKDRYIIPSEEVIYGTG